MCSWPRLLLRGGLFAVYQPVSYSDTGSYRRLAASIQNGWEKYDGTRTPGYPMLLAAAGPDEAVWITQMALGVFITLLFFSLGYQLSGQAWFGGLAALAHTLNLGQLFFEANLITETLATFWVIVTLTGDRPLAALPCPAHTALRVFLRPDRGSCNPDTPPFYIPACLDGAVRGGSMAAAASCRAFSGSPPIPCLPGPCSCVPAAQCAAHRRLGEFHSRTV